MLVAAAAAVGATRAVVRVPRATIWAFTAPWDPASDASVRAHATRVDALVTGWIPLDSATARPLLPSPYPDHFRPPRSGPARMALVTNWMRDRFHPEIIRALAADPTRLAATANLVAQHARQMHYRGLVLDFEGLLPADRDALVRVADSFGDAAHRNSVTPVTIAVPARDTTTYPLPGLLRAADFALVMLYDEHWATSAPGPIASPAWVQAALDLRLGEAPAARLVAGLPTYGYRWRRGAPTESIGWADARRLAADARVPLARDGASGMLTAREPGGSWELWVSDAQLLRALETVVQARGVSRIALWRLGQEDPAIW